MARSTGEDAQALLQSLRSAYAATPKNLKVVYMALVGSFPFNSFLSGVLSCVGTAVLALCLRIQLNKENKEFKDLAPEHAFAGFGARTCFCRFCSLQFGTSFSDHDGVPLHHMSLAATNRHSFLLTLAVGTILGIS